MADPTGRFCLAFNQDTFDDTPTWTRIDSDAHANLVTSYTIDRGRQFELDRTDVGRAVVSIADPDGILDPTNSFGPYYGWIEPRVQACINRYNPVTGTWHTRFRGWIEELDYVYDPAYAVTRLQIELVDVMALLGQIKMLPYPHFGDNPAATTPPFTDAVGQVYFGSAEMGGASGRCNQVLGNAGIPNAFWHVFTGNVWLQEVVYSPGESVLTVIQEAADGEFPGVANVYVDRLGRLAVHGRLARFDPAGTAASAGSSVWDWQHWHAGDGAAVTGAPTTHAQLRRFGWNRGMSKIINSAFATPAGMGTLDLSGQGTIDLASIGQFGWMSWEAQNLLTLRDVGGSTVQPTAALAATKKFADYYLANYLDPQNRVTDCAFRTIAPAELGAAITWLLLSKIDISDRIDLTVAGAGSQGFNEQPFYVEGIHEQVQPLNPTYDDVTLSLDLSPQEYFTDGSMFD